MSAKSRTFPAILLLIVFCIRVLPAETTRQRESEPKEFTTTMSSHGRSLTLRGTSSYNFLAWNVFFIGLYSEEGKDAASALLDPAVPKSLEIHYNWSVDKKELRKRLRKAIQKNPEVDHEELRNQLRKFYSICGDVEDGDISVAEYDPEIGTVFSFNGTEQLTIEGKDFSRAFFSIWLSDNPLQDHMPDELTSSDD